MVDYNSQPGRVRDIQDSSERGLWGEVTYVSGSGAHMTVRGTGTLDEEVPVMNLGYGFNLPKDSNAEVVMLSLGADVNGKVALATIPRDLQYQWGEGQGGVQHPTDASRRLEFNAAETWLKDGVYVLGHDRAVTVTIAGADVSMSMTGNSSLTIAGTADITVAGAATVTAPSVEVNSAQVSIVGATLTHNGVNVGSTHTHPHGDPAGFTGVPQ